MIWTTRRRILIASIKLAAVLGVLAPWLAPGRAEAQYGGGFGGFGWGGYNPNSFNTENYLNQRSLINASAAAANRPQPLTAPAYQYRDDSFYDKYDLATREAMIDRVARHPNQEIGTADPTGMARRPSPRSNSTSTAGAAPATQPPPAEVHLADYFNKDHQLIWPSIAPVSGDLGQKQNTADLAILAVLNEYDMKGLASVSNVTNARQKLLDYGRPALKYVREQSTPAISDSFHVFLLALYSNLGNAATVPKVQAQ